MENASKALIMAAGVLIGLLILSLAVYLFATFGATSAELHKENDASRINQFNTQFTQYEGKSDITIYDVVTVANLAKDNNNEYELTTASNNNFYITVTLKGNSIVNNMERMTDSQLQGLLRNEIQINTTDDEGSTYQTLPTYTCKVTINSNTQRVSKVDFEIKR